MNHPFNSLNQVFNGHEDSGFHKNLGRTLEAEEFSSIRQNFTERPSSMAWPGLSKEIRSKAGELLNVSILDILIRAWNKTGILNKYINKREYDPDEVFLIEFKEHEISSKHKPYLDLEVNSKSIGRINFEIDLSIVIQGAILKIQDAKIKQIRTGSLKVSGAIICEGLKITKKESKEIKLPGEIDLGEGIPIAP